MFKCGFDVEIVECDGIVWVCGDVLDCDVVVCVVCGCSVIVYVVNLFGYWNWVM